MLSALVHPMVFKATLVDMAAKHLEIGNEILGFSPLYPEKAKRFVGGGGGGEW